MEMSAMKKNCDRSDKLWEAFVMTHEKRSYRNAPGCKLLGLADASPVTDHKNRELMVSGTDSEGNRVMISREEALMEFWFPTPAEIEQRKYELQFLFPQTHRERLNRNAPEPMSIPFVTQADNNAPNRYGSADY